MEQSMKKPTGSLLCVAVIFVCAAYLLAAPHTESTERSSSWLVLSHAEYLDRVRAIWTAQMIAQKTGVRFEHQPASTMPVTPLTHLPGFAPVDDDYYISVLPCDLFYWLAAPADQGSENENAFFAMPNESAKRVPRTD